jgi:hypothetical protein
LLALNNLIRKNAPAGKEESWQVNPAHGNVCFGSAYNHWAVSIKSMTRTGINFKQVASDVREYFKDKVYKTMIPRNIKLGEAPSFGKPINLYDPDGIGAQSYRGLAEEVIAQNA